jgi:hypothetical protein
LTKTKQNDLRAILRVEECEPRVVPSDFTWNCPANITGNWSNAAYWIQNGVQPSSRAPSITDDVTFPAGTGDCNFSQTGNAGAYTLTINAGYGMLSVLNGNLEVLNGGTMAGGRVSIDSGRSVYIEGGTFTYTGGGFYGFTTGSVLVFDGTMAISGSAFGFVPQLIILPTTSAPPCIARFDSPTHPGCARQASRPWALRLLDQFRTVRGHS